jgi:hypothetical protein
MKKNILSKTLAMGIVVLFFGAVVVPSINSENNQFKMQDTPIGVLSFDPYAEGWEYRKAITINHDEVVGSHLNFPVLISTTDSDLGDKAQNDGDDILFMDDEDEADQLYHEIEYFDGSNGELVAWVKIPSLPSSQDTIIYMYYGNPDCGSQQNPEDVWNSDYVAVYHMEGSDYTDIDDSTSNDLDVIGVLGNPSFEENGKMGFCVDFDDDSLNVADDNLLSFNGDTPCTIEAWVRCDIPGGDNNPFISKWGHSKREWLLRKNPDDKGLIYFYDESADSSITRKTESDLNVNNDGWNYVAGRYNGGETGYDFSFVLDGVFEEGDQHTGGSYNGMENLDEPMRIGSYHSTNEGKWFYWQGRIDEVRISKTERTSNWLITSYNTMNDPSSFLSFGTEEPNEPPNPPGSPNPDDNEIGVDINADLSWLCNDPDGDDIIYDVFFEAEDPTPDILVSNDQAENIYDPGTMEFGTVYYWQIVAIDEHEATTEGPIWSFTTRFNTSPDAPIINGPIEGKPGTSYSYTFKSTDPEGDNLYYYIDWGDGNIEDWFGPFSSGEEVEKTHVFENKGTYIIYAKAKDTLGSESEWGTFTVTIPRDKVVNRPILQFLQYHPNMFQLLQKLIQNLGL